MKKIILAIILVAAMGTIANAQSDYTTALGVKVDFGSDYRALMGFSAKHFFNEHSAGEAQLNFGTGLTMLGVQYQYHGDIQNAAGLKWYVGVGPAVAFAKSSYYDYYWDYYSSFKSTDFLIRPSLGLDYKINSVPLNFSFDWSPIFTVTHGTSFTVARFGIATRYAF